MASVFVEEYNSLCEAVSIVKGKKVYYTIYVTVTHIVS